MGPKKTGAWLVLFLVYLFALESLKNLVTLLRLIWKDDNRQLLLHQGPSLSPPRGTLEYLNKSVEIPHEPELKGAFKAFRDRGIRITSYREDVVSHNKLVYKSKPG